MSSIIINFSNILIIKGEAMNKLLELRTYEGLTQRDVAKALFVSQGTYNNWENGKTEPSIEQLMALSRFFGESIDYIVGNSVDSVRSAAIKKGEKEKYIEKIEEIQGELEKLKSEFENT